MNEEKRMTDAEVDAILDRIWGPAPPKPKPKAVTNEGTVIRDATVKVSPDDPNYKKGDGGVVKVRRSDFVTVNMAAYEEQQRWKQEEKRHRRRLDPARLGHWGPTDDED